MTLYGMYISFMTIIRKDVVRNVRIWPQTFLPPVVTAALYFLVFGTFLGSRIGDVGDVSYVQFVVPGLIMLSVITNAFSNVATTFFTSKFFFRNIDEILVSPTPPWVIIAGFVFTGVFRGLVVGVLVLLVSLFFAHPVIEHPLIVALFLFMTSLLFSLLGLVNGIYAKSIDGISIIPTFVLTPLVYLGGVFYSIQVLPPFWQILSHFNPVFYLINGFRYGFVGFADTALSTSLSILLTLVGVLIVVNWYLLKKGLGLRS